MVDDGLPRGQGYETLNLPRVVDSKRKREVVGNKRHEGEYLDCSQETPTIVRGRGPG